MVSSTVTEPEKASVESEKQQDTGPLYHLQLVYQMFFQYWLSGLSSVKGKALKQKQNIFVP